MLYAVNLNGEELLMAKKGLVFLHFIRSKHLKKFWNEYLCLLRKEQKGRGGILAHKFC